MSLHVPADFIDHFRRRVIQDAMTEATARYWELRAAQLQRGLTRPGDFPGAASPSDNEAREAALRSAIEACLNRARILRGQV